VKAFGLVGVLVLARVLGLVSLGLPVSAWWASALAWDDLVAGLAFWTVERLIRRPRVSATVYWLTVTWVAINVPVTRALGSPLTVNMLRAAGAPLLDSIAHYFTIGNAVMMGAIALAAHVLPSLVERLARTWRFAGVAVGVLWAAAGFAAGAGQHLAGAERNALRALLQSTLPRVASRARGGDWRKSPLAMPEGSGDLGGWRGVAAGRNVVLIVLESTAAAYLRSYGAGDDPTPSLTALSTNAIQFNRTFAVYPESVKGLFAVLCSRFPAFDLPAETHARSPCASLPAALSVRGYRTALFHSGRFEYLGMHALLSRQGFDTLEDAGAIGGDVQSSFGVDEPSTVTRMLSWIDGLRPREPFFVAYLPIAGHHPYATAGPGPFGGRGAFTDYQNALHEGDRSIGTLLDGFKTRGLAERTIFVLLGDHGEAFGQHPGNYGHSLFIYDENVRVPLVVSIPGVTVGRTSVDEVASTVDIAPTILDLLGLPIPTMYEGGSLLSGASRMALFFTDYSLAIAGLQDGCWKHQLELETGQSRLVNTCEDPRETRNRAAEQPSRVAVYDDRLRQWAGATREAIRHGR